MESNRLGLVCSGAKALKTLTALLWVSTENAGEPPASWAAMGYPGPDGPPTPTYRPISTEAISGDTTRLADVVVVVVGSGAGGGTVAGVLAATGLGVIVLERGSYRNESDFSHLELDAYRSMYLDGALGSTADGGVQMIAGSTLGGGTVVNYATSFATPLAVREEWDRRSGFNGVFEGDRYEQSVVTVQKRLNVNQDNGTPSSRDLLMEKGLRGLG